MIFLFCKKKNIYVWFTLEAILQLKKEMFENGVPIKSATFLLEKKYFHAGKLMAQSILQGGPTPNILAGWCYDEIMKTHNKITPTEEFNQKPVIQKVNKYFFLGSISFIHERSFCHKHYFSFTLL